MTELAPGNAAPIAAPKMNPVDIAFRMLDPEVMNHIERQADALSKAKMIPDTFKDEPGNCLIAVDLAVRLGMAPLSIMQNVDMIHGRPAFRGQFAIALMNDRGPFVGPVQFHMIEDATHPSGIGGCRAWARYPDGSIASETVTWKEVKAEGWDTKPGSKWKTVPGLMFKYRAAAWLCRTACPGVLFGLAVEGEPEDSMTVAVANEATADNLNAALDEKTERESVSGDVIETKPKSKKKTSTRKKTSATNKKTTTKAAPEGDDALAAASWFDRVRMLSDEARAWLGGVKALAKKGVGGASEKDAATMALSWIQSDENGFEIEDLDIKTNRDSLDEKLDAVQWDAWLPPASGS